MVYKIISSIIVKLDKQCLTIKGYYVHSHVHVIVQREYLTVVYIIFKYVSGLKLVFFSRARLGQKFTCAKSLFDLSVVTTKTKVNYYV